VKLIENSIGSWTVLNNAEFGQFARVVGLATTRSSVIYADHVKVACSAAAAAIQFLTSCSSELRSQFGMLLCTKTGTLWRDQNVLCDVLSHLS
jgi:hypothetical protein